MKLLIIEDDPHLSETIRETVQVMFETTQAFDGDQGFFWASQNIFDVIILDIMLPGMSGYEVLDQLRKQGIMTPVILLTAKDGIDDKIHGFKKGADDYLVKPFHREELLLRLEALVRRSVGDFREQTLRFKDLQLHTKTGQVRIGDDIIKLQGKQYDLLEYLLNNRNVILTKEQIFDRIWGFDSETSTSVVEVYASNLRKSLKKYGYDRYIKTFRGMGYMLTENGEENE